MANCGSPAEDLCTGHPGNETEDLHPGNKTYNREDQTSTKHDFLRLAAAKPPDIVGQHCREEQASCAGTFDVKVEKTDSLSPWLQTEDPDETLLQNKTADTGGQRDRGGRDSGEETFYWEVKKTGSSSQLEQGRNLPVVSTKKTYMCGECGFQVRYPSDLRRHMRTHTGEKPYKCDQCDYSATQKSSLTSHLVKHTGDKPYMCDHCDYSAAHKSSLNFHLAKHTGEKPYMCGECGYRTAHKADLSKHMRTHTGEKPYKCDQCDYSAARKVSIYPAI
ncbi:gastrula zinc finger protein XlCGF8.2DB-like [Branchiostoma floridae]|uniref:Gastrula zinc finger protein XlCGF8.2DB-like n=1 Tax=Branchiostoma floridae TaxID=7739 RepID=A0A9J7KLW7_BRAFL|nr:gastrula zinc finger protein XlCGF8.2DB-like [Branchiostoma floridae]